MCARQRPMRSLPRAPALAASGAATAASARHSPLLDPTRDALGMEGGEGGSVLEEQPALLAQRATTAAAAEGAATAGVVMAGGVVAAVVAAGAEGE